MEDCIFCKIIEGKIPAAKIYEDKECIAFLDVSPSAKGQALVVPREHTDSYVFKLSDEELARFMLSVKKVAKLIEKGMEVRRVGVIFEGVEVNHLHAKLYPLTEPGSGATSFYISPKPGRRATYAELDEVANQIKAANDQHPKVL